MKAKPWEVTVKVWRSHPTDDWRWTIESCTTRPYLHVVNIGHKSRASARAAMRRAMKRLNLVKAKAKAGKD